MSQRSELLTSLQSGKEIFINKRSAGFCRQQFLERFSSEQFENTLLATFSK